jgi:predicted extracellular nuclease
MRRLSLLLCVVCLLSAAAQAADLPIGAIQGRGDESPYLNRFVNFRGVVVGGYEDQNTRGDVYYTLFVQSLPEESDGDPATSDAVAVFLGREARRDVAQGDVVRVGGKVTEFYGLTEIDDRGLTVTVADSGPLPAPVALDPPADITAAVAYFEALEGMRVAFPGEVVVAGPAHEGCGFAVVDAADAPDLPILRRADGDPTGRAVPVLYPSDRDCADLPQLKTGDRLPGLAGVLTYNFDQFKVVIDGVDGLAPESAGMPALPTLPTLAATQISVATLNAEDTFDTTRDTAEEGEPVLTPDELAARQAKFVHLIAGTLRCPTLLALQEVEHEALLVDLAAALAEPCGFVYTVSHRETPDARGIDNALLSDPRRARIDDVALRPTCSPVPTGIDDPTIACPAGQEPLFGRPPLQVEADIDGQPYVLYVNHFKSKRDGEIDTDLARIQQAVYLNGLAAERLATDPRARLIALGDFNDTELSPALALLTDPAQGGRLVNALSAIPAEQRYSYVFGGVAELIDGVLLSPALAEEASYATIVHVNTDFPAGWRLDTSAEHLPYRATDHDAPCVVLGYAPATPTPEPTVTVTAPTPAPTATTRPVTTIPATDTIAPSPSAATATPATSSSTAPTDSGAAWVLGLAGVALVVGGGLLARRLARR